MKSNELRVGNWIYPNDENATYYPVLEIMQDVVVCHKAAKVFERDVRIPYSEIRPIPLTEEWLVKVGFRFAKKRNGYNIYFHIKQFRGIDDKIRMNIDDQSRFWFYVYNATVRLYYVHQLQNIYFALTTEELDLETYAPN